MLDTHKLAQAAAEFFGNGVAVAQDAIDQMQSWGIALARNAPLKFGPVALLSEECSLCERLATAHCQACGDIVCLHHARTSSAGDVICADCVEIAIEELSPVGRPITLLDLKNGIEEEVEVEPERYRKQQQRKGKRKGRGKGKGKGKGSKPQPQHRTRARKPQPQPPKAQKPEPEPERDMAEPDLEETVACRVLGVEPGCSWDEINTAFRRLSIKHHPDRKGGDAERFQELSVAYASLKSHYGRVAA